MMNEKGGSCNIAALPFSWWCACQYPGDLSRIAADAVALRRGNVTRYLLFCSPCLQILSQSWKISAG